MNAVEIEQAISALAEQPFDAAEFPFAFLQAFGNKETTLKRLRKGESNKSDLGGVLQTSNIHIAVAPRGEVTRTLAALRASPATARAKAKFILATDGDAFEAEDLNSGETVACAYADFPDHFGFFLPLAGIATVKQISENAFDIRATSRLNRLYVELLKDNPDWGTAERRHDLNHFFARLIFCFFAEDTDIFPGKSLFTTTVEQMSDRDASNTHEVIGTIFRALNMRTAERAVAKLPRWIDGFPYVNGGLFSGSLDAPRFSRIARSYLVHIGGLDWTKINPDIFGSMIQAVAEDEERGALGMHYTSVPNILKVLNPLFLDDLRGKLAEAGHNARALLNLRKRMSKIRVFDPACGSGNFLVIAYKEMRAIEAEINKRRHESGRESDIPLTNFRGIEIRNFPAEVARLALIIAEFQCDVLYRGQKEALAEVIPLDAENWIICGDALRLDWLAVCPPTGTGTIHCVDDLFQTPLDQVQIDFENDGGETYICGNPPYIWSNDQTSEQKARLIDLQVPHGKESKILDYVSGWLLKYLAYSKGTNANCAFVTTNSIVQGSQVDPLWGIILKDKVIIGFAHTAFKWANLAKANAGVTCVIIGLTRNNSAPRHLYVGESRRSCQNISPYLLPMENIWIAKQVEPLNGLRSMSKGNQPTCGGGLILSADERASVLRQDKDAGRFLLRMYGADEIASGQVRYCVWIEDSELDVARAIKPLSARLARVQQSRARSTKAATRAFAKQPHRFTEIRRSEGRVLAIPCVSSEDREYITPVLLDAGSIITNRCFGIYAPPIYYLSILSSKMHQIWVETSSGKLETRLNYSNTLSWNTFPIPNLTQKNEVDLTRCAEDILLAREAHFPATIADLYSPESMPSNLRSAHDRNDEVLERIYIGRRFKNDTERLEKLFELYARMTERARAARKQKARARA
jgi:hypothetical protein